MARDDEVAAVRARIAPVRRRRDGPRRDACPPRRERRRSRRLFPRGIRRRRVVRRVRSVRRRSPRGGRGRGRRRRGIGRVEAHRGHARRAEGLPGSAGVHHRPDVRAGPGRRPTRCIPPGREGGDRGAHRRRVPLPPAR